MQEMAYSSPFGGAEATVSAASDSVVDAGEWGVTQASDATSPLAARIDASRWSREDIELVIRTASAAATVLALYATYRGGR